MAQEPWQEAVTEVWQLFKETDVKFKETDAKFKETDDRLDRLFKETDQKINRLEGLFGAQWGRFMEALVQPNALRLFQERGIRVHYVYQRAKSQINGHTLELDLLLENSGEVVVVEVKSTLRVADVKDFLADLAQFLDFFPKYRGYQVYGAVAALEVIEEADRYAYRQGLFVLGVMGDGLAQIKNDANFKPKDFAKPVE